MCSIGRTRRTTPGWAASSRCGSSGSRCRVNAVGTRRWRRCLLTVPENGANPFPERLAPPAYRGSRRQGRRGVVTWDARSHGESGSNGMAIPGFFIDLHMGRRRASHRLVSRRLLGSLGAHADVLAKRRRRVCRAQITAGYNTRLCRDSPAERVGAGRYRRLLHDPLQRRFPDDARSATVGVPTAVSLCPLPRSPRSPDTSRRRPRAD